MLVTIAYLSEGKSVFDYFFLNHLAQNNYVYLLTFGEKPYRAPQNVHIVRIREPFHPTVSPLKGFHAYACSFLRSILVRRHLNRIKPDVLIGSYAVSYGFYGALSNYSPNLLLVWGSDVLIAPRLLPLRFIAEYALSKADAVVTPGEATKKACVSLGYDAHKIVKFPWVDLRPMLQSVEKNREEFRKKLGWLGDDPIIISTRWHEPIYNVESLVLAAPSIIQEVKNARFLIIGDGSLTEELKKLVHALGVRDNVRFLGRVPYTEMPKYLAMSDIYVSTSLSDGTSASLLEAMACKLSPVVTDIPANREWVENGRSGILVPSKNPKSLAENVVTLLKDEDLQSSLGMRAYEFVLEKADWKKNSKLLDSLILSMIDHRGK
jgi:glycosyltransferase involved in cell wall biosynthesis